MRSECLLSSYYDQDGITIYNARCEQVLPFLDPVDLVLTDPPYGKQWSRGLASLGVAPDMSEPKGTMPWDAERVDRDTIKRVVSAGDIAIVWGGNYYADILGNSNCWLVWDKRVDMPAGPFADCELAWTNQNKVARVFRHCVHGFVGKREPRWHPTQKPLAVMQWAISQAPDTVQTVLDPFMGVGTTLVAAKLMGKRAIGIEVSTEYCERAVERLRQGVLPFFFP